jgi:hypothetical protein
MRMALLLSLLAPAPSAALTTHLDVSLPPLPSGHHLRLSEGLALLEERAGATETASGLLIDNSVPGDMGDLLSVGGTVWPCAAALCRWLRSGASLDGASVLELGAGTGACGL